MDTALSQIGYIVIFKRFERQTFIVLLVATLIGLAISIYSVIAGGANPAKWLASSGMLATASGVFQLEVSGLFKKVLDKYSSENGFPYGSPSYITRQIIDNPDRPFSTWVKNILFYNAATGFWLIIAGTFIQIIAV